MILQNPSRCIFLKKTQIFIVTNSTQGMINQEEAKKVVEVIGNNLIGVSHDSNSFQKLPDSFWGYFARGHDKKGTFGVIITYSEDGKDVDELMKMYEEWAKQNKPAESK